MNPSPSRRSQEEPQRSPQQELFQKLSDLKGVLRETLIDITRTGIKRSIEDLEMDLLLQDFAQEFGFGKRSLKGKGKSDEERVLTIKKRLQELSREITTLLRDYGKSQSWSNGQAAKAKLLLYRVEEFVSEIDR